MDAVVAQLKTQITERPGFNRLLEIIPGSITWLFLIGPVLLSLVRPVWVAYFIIAFDLFWLVKSLRLSTYLIRGYSKLYRLQRIDWLERLGELEDVDSSAAVVADELSLWVEQHPKVTRRIQFSVQAQEDRAKYLLLKTHLAELEELQTRQNTILKPSELYNVVILATYNESLDILEPSVQALIDTNYPIKQLMLVVAYEERGGKQTEDNANYIIDTYGDKFAYAVAIKHPDGLAGEVRGKGANITFAGRLLTDYINEQQIDPEHVIVTTFDSDHRPSANYFAHLSYSYATNVNRVRKSYQPIPMFYNNIWDAPAPMRIIATGNSFWMIMEAMRPRRLRNFAAHAQSLRALIDTDYWSVTSIVEDGHQYWRTYFTYDGDHQVVPLFVPVFQDAVLAKSYLKTFKVQYLQLRRWAWGISDFPYVVINAMRNKRIKTSDKLLQIGRLFEGHFSWATAPVILTFVAWLPLFLNRRFSEQLLAHELPVIASRILTLAMLGIFTTILISLLSLPPKPARYRRTRFIGMIAQWVLLPFTAIFFSSFAAIDAQTRLMFGRYLDFRVTEKATKR